MTGDRFRVDLDRLDEVVTVLARHLDRLESLAAELRATVRRLHEDWDGTAATAHAEVQARWDDGFGSMRSALADMRAAAGTARDNYTGATEANLALWQELG